MAQTRPSPTLSRGFTRLGHFLAPYGSMRDGCGGGGAARERRGISMSCSCGFRAGRSTCGGRLTRMEM